MFSFSATDVYGLIIDQFQSRHILFGYSFNCFCFFVFFVFLFFCFFVFFVFLFFCYFVFLFFCFFVIYSLHLFICSLMYFPKLHSHLFGIDWVPCDL